MTTRLAASTIVALSALLALSPSALGIGSAANPGAHEYYGISATGVLVTASYDTGTQVLTASNEQSVGVAGVCADLSPLGTLFPLPPNIQTGDGVPETGVGNACFPFHTIYGNDTGTTKTVEVSNDLAGFSPIYTVCVDNNGDGICQAGVDETNLCWSGPTSQGHISLVTGGDCTIYLNPAATLNPNVYVQIVASVDITTGGVTTDGGAVHGFAYYL